MLFFPKKGVIATETNVSGSTAEFGTSVVAGAANTKNTSYTQLVASTAQHAYGITVVLSNTAVASTRVNALVDIAIGAAASEVVIVPNLIGGNASPTGAAQGPGHIYHFPIMIPRATRISANAAMTSASDSVNVGIYLHENPLPGKWYGERVTAYGINAAASNGTAISPGSNVYATDVTLTTATTNAIRYAQVGTDLSTATSGTNSRGLMRISRNGTVIVADLPYTESTTVETTHFAMSNMILAQMFFDVPAGAVLTMSAMRNAAAAARTYALYGVD